MKTIQLKLWRISLMVCTGLSIALGLIPGFSCKKNNFVQPPFDAQSIANSLKGEVLTGALSTASDEEGIALLLDGERLLIALEKIPMQAITDPGNIAHVQIIYSDYGIIVRDADAGKSWYYIQNNEESKKRFRQLPGAGENAIFSSIAGTIKLNLLQNS